MADHPLVIVFRHRLPGDGEHAGLAIRAAPLPTGEELVAIDRRGVPAFMAGERLVAFEPVGDVAEHLPQRLAMHQLIDAADGVDAGDPGPHDAAQPRGDAEVLLQAVEAAATSSEEGKDTGKGRRGGDLRTGASIGQVGQLASQPKDLIDIGTEPCHHGEWSSDGERLRPCL